ncbi:MAG: hypothetical protein IPJ18_10565 [Betaproteobacteria bacterium]|nr:hypothetical protein [Betaproteobacteria bacterium]
MKLRIWRWRPLLSLSASFAIVATQRWPGVLTNDVVDGIQKFHTDPTPRVGGVPILFGLLIAWVLSSGVLANLLGVLLVASLPAQRLGWPKIWSKGSVRKTDCWPPWQAAFWLAI